MCSHARRGSNRMSWIFWQMSATMLPWHGTHCVGDVTGKAIKVELHRGLDCGGGDGSCLIACLRVLCSVYSGARVEQLIWNQTSN